MCVIQSAECHQTLSSGVWGLGTRPFPVRLTPSPTLTTSHPPVYTLTSSHILLPLHPPTLTQYPPAATSAMVTVRALKSSGDRERVLLAGYAGLHGLVAVNSTAVPGRLCVCVCVGGGVMCVCNSIC